MIWLLELTHSENVSSASKNNPAEVVALNKTLR